MSLIPCIHQMTERERERNAPLQQDSSLVLRLQVTKDLLFYAMLRLQLDFETHAECYVYGAVHLIRSVG